MQTLAIKPRPERGGAVMGPKDPRGKSPVIKRNVRIDGHLTTLSLEDAFWNAFKEIAAAKQTEIGVLVESIESKRRKAHHLNLSSAIRLFVLDYYRSRCAPG
jgi:predicted DNA-binding ribbon-helix-helix protein